MIYPLKNKKFPVFKLNKTHLTVNSAANPQKKCCHKPKPADTSCIAMIF
jgi:hypothetical protein